MSGIERLLAVLLLAGAVAGAAAFAFSAGGGLESVESVPLTPPDAHSSSSTTIRAAPGILPVVPRPRRLAPVPSPIPAPVLQAPRPAVVVPTGRPAPKPAPQPVKQIKIAPVHVPAPTATPAPVPPAAPAPTPPPAPRPAPSPVAETTFAVPSVAVPSVAPPVEDTRSRGKAKGHEKPRKHDRVPTPVASTVTGEPEQPAPAPELEDEQPVVAAAVPVTPPDEKHGNGKGHAFGHDK